MRLDMTSQWRVRRAVSVCAVLFCVAGLPAGGATKSVDLDAKTANGAESNVSLTVLTSFPAKVENKVTNKAIGDVFSFQWASAGPGGFTSSAGAGTSTGVGAKWTWQTAQTIYSFTGTVCEKDVCFTKTAGPDPVTTRGPFSVPGRSLTPSNVTLSSASLTSSLITFFSPPQVLVSVTSSVEPLAQGGFAYTTRIENGTDAPITVDLAPGPPGCCPEPHQLNCDGTCVSYRSDPTNCGGCGIACGFDEYCAEGACVQVCPQGMTACGDSCVDLQTDPLHCGGCDLACGDDEICTGGACVECRPPNQTACDNQCVNIHTDAFNCGGCGIDCNFLCPSTGQGACSQGQSCQCVTGAAASFGASAAAVVEAPVCEVPASSQTIPPGGVVEDCSTRPLLAKEVASLLTVCGTSIPDGDASCGNGDPASQGTFLQLVPDMSRTPGAAFLTPFHVELKETSGDGLLQPGETGKLKVALLNVGSSAIAGVVATLASPPVDLTDDGATNPIGVTLAGTTQGYGNIAGISVTGGDECGEPTPPLQPAINGTPFQVTLPAGHPGDVARPFTLHVEGAVVATGAPFVMDVPLTLGIAGACDRTAGDRSYDGVKGLLTPMAALVPEGDVVPYPSKPFQQGKTRPMKLQLLCGGVNLTGSQVDAPEIVGLSEAIQGPLPVSALNLNADSPNSNDPFFRFNASTQHWIYNMRTRDLAKGTYVLTIRIAGRKDYVTGFVLN